MILPGFSWKPDLYCGLTFSGSIEIKILENTFGAITFASLKISIAKIRKLRVWTETDLSFYKKHFHCFMKPEYSVVTHSYKWAIADVLSGKIFFSTKNPSYNEPWRGHGISFDIITIRNCLKQIKQLRFSVDPNRLSL